MYHDERFVRHASEANLLRVASSAYSILHSRIQTPPASGDNETLSVANGEPQVGSRRPAARNKAGIIHITREFVFKLLSCNFWMHICFISIYM